MTARRASAASPSRRPGDGRGFTLLEVLVALLIIAGALAGIAALLPAAGARLADATDIDRAATMAANARADLVNRGLLRYQLWQQSTGTTAGTRAIVFGDGLTIDGTAVAMTSATSTIALAGRTAVAQRIDPASGFRLRDQVLTTGTGTVVVTGTGFEPGICYGCMLSSTAAPTAAGATMRLTTVVFRRPAPAVKPFTLTVATGTSVFAIGSGPDVASDRRRFLPGCSWVLAVGSGEPLWLPIASSWTAFGPGQTTGSGTGASYVALSGSIPSGSTLQVFGFEGLLRVDERFVNLE